MWFIVKFIKSKRKKGKKVKLFVCYWMGLGMRIIKMREMMYYVDCRKYWRWKSLRMGEKENEGRVI